MKRYLTCLLSSFIAFLIFQTNTAQVPDKKITIPEKDLTGLILVNAIKNQTGLRFNYGEAINSKLSAPIKINKQQISVKDVLELIRTTYGINNEVSGEYVTLLLKPASPANPAQKKGPGKVTGKIIDEENDQAVVGATIRIGEKNTTSSIDGSFNVLLPKGSYTAIISYVGYGTKEVSDIEVKDNESFLLNITLKRAAGTLAGVVVRSSAKKEGVVSLYNRQKNNAAITDGISAEQISRTPDKNIGEVLKRISGLSTLENKYVVVRGLSERYNQAVLNGQVMPSTELNRKNFSFDLIPSNIVENVTVIKTLTPDRSAEFGGGLIEVNTLDIPNSNFLNISVGGSINTNTTSKNFQSLELSGSEYAGKAASHRNLLGKLTWTNTKDAVEAYNAGGKDARLLSNNWGVHEMKASPSQHYQLSAGRVIPLSAKNQLGVILALSYRNTFATQDIEMNRDAFEAWNEADGVKNSGLTGKRYGFTTNLSGMLGLGYRTEKFRIGYQSMYLRNYDQQLILGTGNHVTIGRALGYYDLTAQTDLWQQQVKGELAIGRKGIKLQWMGAITRMDRNKPDNHQLSAAIPESEYVKTNNMNIRNPLSSLSMGVLRWWSRALEKNYTWDVSTSLPFKVQIGKFKSDNTFKAGYAGWMKDRLFYVLNTASHHYDTQDFPVIAKAFIPERGGQIEISQFADDFNKTARLHAVYGMFDNKIGSKWRLVWGVRAEYYDMHKANVVLDSLASFLSGGNGINNSIDYSALTKMEPNWRFFPSANLTYHLAAKMNLRLAYARSIIRPDLREQAYFKEYDFELGGDYIGNFVRSTLVRHLDFRYEYYPSPGEIFSLSLFHKDFKYPMEIYKEGDNRQFTLRNNASATNLGIEIELRKTLAFTKLPVIKNITLYGNFTALNAKVKPYIFNMPSLPENSKVVVILDSIGAEEKRPQSGASNYMMNAGIYYDTKLLSLSLVYNYVTNRMFRPSYLYKESLFERPLQALDGQVAIHFLQHKAVLRLSVANLLDSYYVIYRNSFTTEEAATNPSTKELLYQKEKDLIDYKAKPGRTYSATLSYNF